MTIKNFEANIFTPVLACTRKTGTDFPFTYRPASMTVNCVLVFFSFGLAISC